MSETLVELVARIKADATGLEKGLTDAERKTEASSKNMADSLKRVGIAMAASGAAITAALGLMGKAAIDEEINIKHLQVALKGVGVDYDNVKDSLEAVFAATQRKTGIADNEQRDTLARLILVTKDYDKALKLLPLALDLAAYSQMNASSAATYLAKAYEELEAGADKIGIRMGTTTVYFKDLDEVQKMVGGTAEAMKNPFSVLTATMGDLSETIGSFLIPIIKEAVDKIVDIATKVQAWAKEHPVLAKNLTIVALGLGAVLTIIGGLILILPTVIAGVIAFGIVFHAALGPIGLISLAIAGLITIGILLWKNWDTIKNKTIEIWNNIANFFSNVWYTIVGFFQENWDKILAILFPAIGLPILIARNWGMITDIVKNIWDKATGAVKTAWDKLVTFILSGVDWLIGRINLVISLINRIPGINIGSISRVEGAIQGYASGGIVPGSIGQPQLAMVHGGETIIPANEGIGGITIQFTEPVFFEREDDMNRFVDKISKVLDRKNRLRFGRAYSG